MNLRIINPKAKQPTVEQVIKEFEELGYQRKESKYGYIYLREFDEENIIIREIIINTKNKSYEKRYSFITFEEHQLLTKLFKALGWYDE